MARYKDEQCRRCRREGQKLFLKGERCYSDKCSISRRNYAPGQHGQKRAKLSEYGTQLREKQKTKAYYGVGEKQFRKYFEMASNKKGVTGENLLQILESRLDNVVYRLGFGTSRAQARQFVNHGQFEVNGKRVDIPSYLVKPGDVITVRESKKDNTALKTNVEDMERYTGIPVVAVVPPYQGPDIQKVQLGWARFFVDSKKVWNTVLGI